MDAFPPEIPGAFEGARRGLLDRRRRPTPLLEAVWPGGRRRAFRRAGEGRSQYVDQLSARAVTLALVIVTLSSLDALFTLLHLQKGGQEVNPVMGFVLRGGPGLFIAVKTWGTALAVMFLAVHQNFRVSWIALHGVALLYFALLAYHVALLLC